MNNAIHWFEIFVSDLERAKRFYETLLGVSLRREDYARVPSAVFEADKNGVAGGIVQDPSRRPGPGGSLLYLNANGKLDACLERVAAAGGQMLMPKTDIGDPGFIAVVRDTEGNVVGLHSERGAVSEAS
jgi:predicted enzyme related to lactoylglutathione lyase